MTLGKCRKEGRKYFYQQRQIRCSETDVRQTGLKLRHELDNMLINAVFTSQTNTVCLQKDREAHQKYQEWISNIILQRLP